ncbi:MAG: class I SAM-dependent methyltransferase [Planctomycetota bacterium]|jgi:predicted O-methyltransferase YrrM
MPDCTTKWFKRADMEMWLDHLGYMRERPTRYLEVGVFEGRSACWVLDNLLTHPESVATCVDPWDVIEDPMESSVAEIEGRARQNLEPYGRKVLIVKQPSDTFMSAMVCSRGSYDLIYVDGSHRLEHAWVDTGLAWQLLRVGGVLVWDDYNGKIKRAVDIFVELVEAKLVWKTRRQIAVRKEAEE